MPRKPSRSNECGVPNCRVTITVEGAYCSKCGSGFCLQHMPRSRWQPCPACGARFSLKTVTESFQANGPSQDVKEAAQSFLSRFSSGGESTAARLKEAITTAPVVLIVETVAAIIAGLLVAYLVWRFGIQ